MAETARRSIERTLPTLICGLLLAVVGSLFWVAHHELEVALLSGVQARLDRVTTLLSDLLVRSVDGRMAVARATADRPELAAYLASPGADGGAAREAMAELAASQPTNLHAVELWDRAGECRIAVPGSDGASGPPAPDASGPGCRGVHSRAPSSGPSPFRVAGEQIVYDLVVPVGRGAGTPPGSPAEEGDAPGALVEIRTLSGGESAALIAGLIGSDAVFLLGNADGSTWFDLASPVPGPPAAAASGELVRYQDARGVSWVGMANPLPGTPWLVWVGFPRSVILTPLQAFLQRTGTASVVILLLGSAGAWLVSHRIALPLRQVTEAAEAIAGGEYSSRVEAGRNDETGRLAAAFNVMADRVDRHQRELESRVEDRTRELSDTLEHLREAQDRLVRRERLAILGQLASGVGHELRNPLGVMSNAVYYLELVLSDARQDVRDYLGILNNQIALSEKIVEDLLDFARVKPPQREAVALAELVDEQLERLAIPDEVVVERDFAPGIPAAWVDRGQVGQVVVNLLTNAIQAVEQEGGTLTLRAAPEDADRVRLDVTDSGAGIAPENMERIFEPLYTTKARGIGLGLAVARSLVEANGGALTVTSPPGSGATFSLVLPSREAVDGSDLAGPEPS